MGFDGDFINKCDYQYYWNFSSLFPALYDGSFFADTISGPQRGQVYLRGFAMLLCSTFAERSEYRTELNDAFERSLQNDGYKVIDGKLVEIGIDTSTRSELTALQNAKSLLTDLAGQLQKPEPVAILFVDLDNFKQVNDRLGHSEGDRCLNAVVRTISRAIVHKGKLYRVGGDEFCVMLLNSSISEAFASAERLRSSRSAEAHRRDR